MPLSVLIYAQKASTRKIKKPASERRAAFSFLCKSNETAPVILSAAILQPVQTGCNRGIL